MRVRYLVGAIALAWLAAAWSEPCAAFYVNGQWATVAHGAAGAVGTPTTLTWTIVPDGTPLAIGGTSNLISFLDGLYGAGASGTNMSLRPWFPVVDSAFNRWAQLGGASLDYGRISAGSYLADDGAHHGNAAGLLDVRGDVRLAGKNIDGAGGTNASTGFVSGGADITLDTADGSFFSAVVPGTTDLNIRNTLMHEIGHSLGLAHMGNSSVLMYPFSSTAYDGPQFDDVRGLHQQYGDAMEKGGGGAGNNTLATATPLGLIASGQTLSLGVSGNTGTKVEPSESDFLSISNAGDVDYFRFALTEPSWVDAQVTPVGPSYGQRPNTSGGFTTITSSAVSDLSLELYALVGESWQLRSTANGNPIGLAESLLDSPLTPGEYAVRVAGSTSMVQTYELQLFVETRIPGDFDHNNRVDGTDLLAWQQGLGVSRTAAELEDWRANFGQIALQSASAGPVPEPGTLLAAIVGLVATGAGRGRVRKMRLSASPASVEEFS